MTEPDDMLAAEYALSLLEGEELAEAKRLLAADAAFAARVGWWQERLAPLCDEAPPLTPSPELWIRINGELDAGGREGNVRGLERRLWFWRTYGSAATAVAAALLLGLATTWRDNPRPPVPAPTPAPAPPVAPAPVLVATVAAEDRSSAFVVTVDRDRRQLLVGPALVEASPDRDFQLWLLGPDGTPASLGVISSREPGRLPLPPGLAANLREAATLAVSIEPRGGSPTGLPTGPVIATGPLRRV